MPEDEEEDIATDEVEALNRFGTLDDVLDDVAEHLTGDEIAALRESPHALSEAIATVGRDDSSSEVCPGCGEALRGESQRIEGDHGEQYCSIECLREVYSG